MSNRTKVTVYMQSYSNPYDSYRLEANCPGDTLALTPAISHFLSVLGRRVQSADSFYMWLGADAEVA